MPSLYVCSQASKGDPLGPHAGLASQIVVLHFWDRTCAQDGKNGIEFSFKWQKSPVHPQSS
jgi:hypothetical protein